MIDFGILGMNARNLLYIKKFNTKKAIRLADNKSKTKRFLSARGIPVPETYDIIKTYKQLWEYDFSQLPVNDFIIKPVRGSRGRGIYRVKNLGEREGEKQHITGFGLDRFFTQRSPFKDHQYKVGGEIINDTVFRRYLLDILYGRNSLMGERDQIMIEELLLPGGGFEQYCEYGLADIRIIVFNLIPVAAMLRVPTIESDGKANLDRGALGMGVEVGTGKIYSMYKKGVIYRNIFPEGYQLFAHRTLPFWDDILSYSSRIQYFANLGYLALDWVVTNDGPKLLEINARAGLKFQLAAQLPLAQRLRKIGDIKVVNPEKGVEIAQTLFSQHKSQLVTPSKIVYLSQHGKLIFLGENGKVDHDVIVKVDLSKRHNYLPKKFYANFLDSKKTKISLGSSSINLSGISWQMSEKLEKNTVILGRESVADYYVKPIHTIFTKLDFINPKNIQKSEIDNLHILDKQVDRLGKILNTSRIFRPTNFFGELDTFISLNGDYNPQFMYRWPTDEKLSQTKKDLEVLLEKYFGMNGLQSKFAQLFKHKIEELLIKHDLIVAYKKQKIKKIQHVNEKLFGKLDTELTVLSKDVFVSPKLQNRKTLGPILSRSEILTIIKDHLTSVGIPNVIVRFTTSGMGRIVIKRGKTMVVNVALDSGFREIELRATLAHEIDVHIKRHQAGYATGRRLLQNGTAGYIKDEEGMAIMASEIIMPDDYEKTGMYDKYYLMSIAGEKSFAEIAGIVRGVTNKTLIGSFKAALRLKKGLEDTENRGGAVFLKDKIYLDGYTNVKNRIDKGGDIEKLYIGKIKIDDIPYIY